MEVKERIKLSFSFAGDVVKQLIALSTAIVTLCVALTDKLFSSEAVQIHSIWLLVALGLFVLSILCGLLTMMAMTGTLGKPKEGNDNEEAAEEIKKKEEGGVKKDKDVNKGTIYQGNIRVLMFFQLASFFLAIVLAMVFVVVAAFSSPNSGVEKEKPATEQTNSIQVLRTSSYTVIDSLQVDTVRLEMK